MYRQIYNQMKIEKRITTSKVERAEGDDNDGKIIGMASRVGIPYDMGWFDEIIEPGAFDATLGDDVRVLYNHNDNMILGRTKSKTAKVYLDGAGNLMYEYKTPNRSYAKDLEDAIKTGDVDQSSFAFVIEDEEWSNEDGRELRKIKKIGKLFDVSPVTYPANPDTSVAKRSFEKYKETEQVIKDSKDDEAKRSKADQDKLKLSIALRTFS